MFVLLYRNPISSRYKVKFQQYRIHRRAENFPRESSEKKIAGVSADRGCGTSERSRALGEETNRVKIGQEVRQVEVTLYMYIYIERTLGDWIVDSND